MKKNAPDEMHMARRYVTFIEILTNVALCSAPSIKQSLPSLQNIRTEQGDGPSTNTFYSEDIFGFEELNNSLGTNDSFWNLGWADLSSYLEQ